MKVMNLFSGKGRLKRRGSSRYIVVFIFSLLVLVLIFGGIRLLISRMAVFTIREIAVKGNRNLETEFLANLVKEYRGCNLFEVSAEEIGAKYSNIIRIESIRVKRLIPGTLKILINERFARFCLRTVEGNLYPIDGDRVLLDSDNFYAQESMPVISTEIKDREINPGQVIEDDFINRVYDFCASLEQEDPSFINRISEFYLQNGEIYMIDSNSGYRIVFGSEGLEDKYRRFAFLEKNRSFQTNTLIDLRFRDRLIIHPGE